MTRKKRMRKKAPFHASPEISMLVPGEEPPVKRGKNYIPVYEPTILGSEIDLLKQCVEKNEISSLGAFVGEFEDKYASLVSCRYGVSCSSGAMGLMIALSAMGVSAGDEVIMPCFTMIAVANAAHHLGATPVFVDISYRDWNLDAALIEEAITPATKAIIPVHTYGMPCDMDHIMDIAGRHQLWVLEDASEAHGSEYKNRKVGCLGDAAVFSLYANKLITTGEGGIITSNDKKLSSLIRTIRDHAFSSKMHFWHQYHGFNGKMSNLQAAFGCAQLHRFEWFVDRHIRNANHYIKRLSRVKGIRLPRRVQNTKNVYWVFTLFIEDDYPLTRDELRIRLARSGIETRSGFVPLHIQPIYFSDTKYPVSEDVSLRTLYVPSFTHITAEQIDRICDIIENPL